MHGDLKKHDTFHSPLLFQTQRINNFRKLLKMLHTKDKGGGGGTQNKTKTHLYLQWTLFSKQPSEFWPIVFWSAQQSIQQVVSIFRMSGNVLLWSFSLCGTTVPSIGKSYKEQTFIDFMICKD